MEEFPNEAELTVASALLLLSCTTFPKLEEEENRNEFGSKKANEKLETELKCSQTSSETVTCVSSLTYDESSVHSSRLKLIEFEASPPPHRYEFKLKVAKKARSKVIYRTSTSTSSHQVKPAAQTTWKSPPITKPKKLGQSSKLTNATATTTTITAEGSCLSSGGSSEITSARSNRSNGRRPEIRERKGRAMVEKKRRGVASFHLRRRAEAIMRFLGNGRCASEVRIRQVLGDSPDTSKALRMLLRMEEVKRTGAGGRSDPFIYKIAAENDSVASCLSQALIV